jgi:arginine decarboxylase
MAETTDKHSGASAETLDRSVHAQAEPDARTHAMHEAVAGAVGTPAVSDGAWTSDDSAALYGIPHWGDDYFSVSPVGTVQVHPEGPGGPKVDLLDLVQEIRRRGLHTPLLIRFTDILARRIAEIDSDFKAAIAEYEYRGRYRGVYPIKVNQQRQVVEEMIEFGRPFGLGLEVGSKAELLVALAMLDTEGALIVCNGYKDRAYIEMALLAQRLGRSPILVVDRPSEVDVLIKTARELGIHPHVGIRARLAARGEGKWVESSGDRAKFGLSASEIVYAVDRLRAEDMLDSLEMLHFHIGSQITAIRAHKDALREASRIFVGLWDLGAKPRLLDVGGGLAVDYDGSQTNFQSSMNYTSAEYAMDVVAAIAEACNERNIPHPDLVTESGRALVSAGSVLVFDVLDVDEVPRADRVHPPAPGEHRLIRELYEISTHIDEENALESYHDATQLKEEGQSLFALGYLDLAARARFEELYWSCVDRIQQVVSGMSYVPEDLQRLERQLSDTYYGNFSVFQSLPDTWALDQLFPVMPIHRLDERPTQRGTFVDLTCDSDGRLDQFIDRDDVKHVLPLHAPNGRPYYIAVFLVGAYQETLGELHNLYGDTGTVHVKLQAGVPYKIEHVVEGDSVEEVLGYVNYGRRRLSEHVRRAVEDALARGEISIEESARLRRRFEQGLSGYTYLDSPE